MPGFSANAQAIGEIPQLPRHFQKCLISENACDNYTIPWKENNFKFQSLVPEKMAYQVKIEPEF